MLPRCLNGQKDNSLNEFIKDYQEYAASLLEKRTPQISPISKRSEKKKRRTKPNQKYKEKKRKKIKKANKEEKRHTKQVSIDTATKHPVRLGTQIQGFMSCLDDYIEKIHHLPLDVNRNLRLIQELDRRATKAKDQLEQFREELQASMQASGVNIKNKASYNFNEQQKKIIECIDKSQTEYYHLCEEKCKVADQIYQEIQLQHDELINETKRFLGENPSVKATLPYPLPPNQTPIQEMDFVPSQMKKKKKNEEKRAQKVKEMNDNLDSYMNSPPKNQNQGGSLNSSFQEAHGYTHQFSQQNNLQNTQPFYSNGKLNGSASNIDQIKASKRLTKSKYASSNRQEEQKYCCGQKIDSSFVQCDSCSSWFHHSCVGMEQNYIPTEDWHCNKCKGDLNADNYSTTSISVASKLAPTRSSGGNISVRKHSKISNN